MSIIRGSQLGWKVRPAHPMLQPCCQSLAFLSFSLERLVSDWVFVVVALQSAHKCKCDCATKYFSVVRCALVTILEARPFCS